MELRNFGKLLDQLKELTAAQAENVAAALHRRSDGDAVRQTIEQRVSGAPKCPRCGGAMLRLPSPPALRRPGKPKIRLRGTFGSEEFMTTYRAALTESAATVLKAEKSLDWLCNRYYKSASYQSLEEYTKRRKRAVLDEVCNITFGVEREHPQNSRHESG